MCFQAFIRFRCGHSSLTEQHCAGAEELDVPLWLKIACPNYTTTGSDVTNMCGLGKYYCAQTDFGRQLNRVYEERDLCETRLQGSISDAVARTARWKQSVLQRLLGQHDGDLTRTKAAFMHDLEGMQVLRAWTSLKQHRTTLLAQKVQREQIIHRCRQSFLLQLNDETGVSVDLMGVQAASGPVTIPTSCGQYAHLLRPVLGQSVSAAPAAGFEPYGGLANARARRSWQPTEAVAKKAMLQQRRDYELELASDAEGSPKKRGRPRRKVEHAGQVQPPSNVRRSARVRAKHVNYAEDSSDVFSPSRSASPARSDFSTFSPPKSDASFTPSASSPKKSPLQWHEHSAPAKHKIDRPGNSLGAIIKDWRRKEAAAGFEGTAQEQQIATSHAEQAHYASEEKTIEASRSFEFPASDRQTLGPAVPPKEVEEPPRGAAKQSNETAYPIHARQTWPVDRGDVNIALHPAFFQPGRQGTIGTTDLSYELLQQHFNSPVKLEPVLRNAAQQFTPAWQCDPKKRNLVALTADFSSNKRARLSLPGEGNTPNLLPPGQGAWSPPEVPGTAVTELNTHENTALVTPSSSNNQTRPHSDPEPAPTAVMLSPFQQIEAHAEATRGEEVGSIMIASDPDLFLDHFGGLGNEGTKLDFSDVDWNMATNDNTV